MIVCRQLDPDMLKIRRALGAQVNDEIDNRAASRRHDLAVGRGWELEMHAANRAFALTENHVRLRNYRVQLVFLELMLTEGPREKPTLVLAALEFENERARKSGLDKSHPVLVSLSGIVRYGASGAVHLQLRNG